MSCIKGGICEYDCDDCRARRGISLAKDDNCNTHKPMNTLYSAEQIRKMIVPKEKILENNIFNFVCEITILFMEEAQQGNDCWHDFVEREMQSDGTKELVRQLEENGYKVTFICKQIVKNHIPKYGTMKVSW